MVRFYIFAFPGTSTLLSARGHVRQEALFSDVTIVGRVLDLEERSGAPSGAQNADKGRSFRMAWDSAIPPAGSTVGGASTVMIRA